MLGSPPIAHINPLLVKTLNVKSRMDSCEMHDIIHILFLITQQNCALLAR